MDLQVKGQVCLISKMSFGSRHKVLLYLQPYTVSCLKDEAEQLICLNKHPVPCGFSPNTFPNCSTSISAYGTAARF